jgi:hypothetical protein
LNPLPRLVVAAVLAAVSATAARAADPTDPADLFPADTLAYAELHDPAAVGPEIAAVVKGTVLEDSLAFVHGRRDAAKTPHDLLGKRELAVLGLLASPEMAAEFKKFRGMAVGLTGFTERGEPQWAAAVLTGDSPAAGLAARAFLTLSSVRKVGTVGDVPVYQFRQPTFTYNPNDGRQKLDDKPPAEGPYEATFAYVPGLFVVGTNRAVVGEVVTRFRGQGKGTLAAAPAFKEAAAAHRRPGVFFFANAAEFCAKFDAARQAGGGAVEPDAYGWFKLVLNAKAVRHLAGSVRFRDGGLALTVGAVFDPAQKSPLLSFLSGPGAKAELLHSAPAPASVAVAVTLPETGRAAAVIGFLDALAKANGELGRLPGEAVKELEAKYKVPLTDGLIGKTRAVTVVLPVKQELPKGAVALPVLVLHTESPDVAAAWEDFLPKLIGDLGGAAPPQPASETVSGVKVLSLAGTGLPWKAAVHYARKDGVIAIGLDRKLVAAAALADPNGSVVGGNAGVVPAGEAPVLLGRVGLGGVVRGLTESPPPDGPVVPVTPVGPGSGPRPPGFRPGGPGPAAPTKQKEEEAKALAEVLKAFDGLPPVTVTARRAGAELRVELWQPKVQGGIAPVVSAGVGWVDVFLNRFADPNGAQYGRYPRFRGDW